MVGLASQQYLWHGQFTYQNVCIGAAAINSAEFFSVGLSPGALSHISCLGNETRLLDCPFESTSSGSFCTTGGVSCPC